MATRRKIIGSTLGALAAGYIIGIMTAPRSGKQTRRKAHKLANQKAREADKQLKTLYKQTQEAIDKFSKQNPQVAKLRQAKVKADLVQAKVKELLSAIHGNDAVDEDLDAAITDAKLAYKKFNDYIKKT